MAGSAVGVKKRVKGSGRGVKGGKTVLDSGVLDKLLDKGDRDEIEESAAWLRQIIYADSRKLFDGEGKLLSPLEWPDEIRPAVKKISLGRYGPIVDMHDPMSAHDRLAKIMGWYQQNKVEMTPLEELMQRIPRERLRAALEVLLLLTSEEPVRGKVEVVEAVEEGGDEG